LGFWFVKYFKLVFIEFVIGFSFFVVGLCFLFDGLCFLLVDFVFYLVGFRFCCILIDLQMIDRIILYIAQNKSYA